MNDLVAVFEITAGSNGIRSEALFRFIIGVAGLIAGVWTIRRACARQELLKELVPAVFLIGWGVFWLVMHMPLWKIATIHMHQLLDVYQSGHSEVTEGVVHVTHVQPAQGHASGDKIAIGNRTFEINYYLVTPGYKQTIAHGGVLREGVFARLHHYNGVILKVEVVKSAVGRPTSRAETISRTRCVRLQQVGCGRLWCDRRRGGDHHVPDPVRWDRLRREPDRRLAL